MRYIITTWIGNSADS